MSAHWTPSQLLFRIALPGSVVAWCLAAAVVLSGALPPEARDLVWLGAASGTVIGVLSCWVLVLASRRKIGPDGAKQAGLTIQAAALGTFLLKILGAGAVVAGGFLAGLKFPQVATLAVAYAAAAVCIQVLGSLALARFLASLAATAPSAAPPSGAAKGSAP